MIATEHVLLGYMLISWRSVKEFERALWEQVVTTGSSFL